jgi:hypothetical protein
MQIAEELHFITVLSSEIAKYIIGHVNQSRDGQAMQADTTS